VAVICVATSSLTLIVARGHCDQKFWFQQDMCQKDVQ
jgi:hypothetical protein